MTRARAAEARAALDRGNALFHGPRWRESRAEYDTARGIFTELDDSGGLADALCNLAGVAWRLRDLRTADALYDRARDLYVTLGAGWHVAKVEQYQGNVAYHRGDLHRTRWFYDRARTALLDGDHALDVADIDVNLAGVLGDLGDHERALALLDEAGHLYDTVLDPPELTVKHAEIDQNRGLAHLERDDLALAWRHLARALRVQRTRDDREKVADLLHDLANTAARLRRSPAATTLYERAIAAYAAFGDDRGAAADCHLGLGALLWRDGDLDAARHHLDTAAAAYTAGGEWLAAARARHNLALLHPVDSADRAPAVIEPWLAMQSIDWGLPEVGARAAWRQSLDNATTAALESAIATGNAMLAAEIIETLRSAPLAPTASVPLGVTAGGATVHDLPARRPAVVDCGWPSGITRHLAGAEAIRNVGGTDIRLRTGTTSLLGMLTP